MKVGRAGEVGRERPVVLDERRGLLLDVSAHVPEVDGAFLAGGGLARLAELVRAEGDRLPTLPLGGVRLGPPVARPPKVVCIGLNYADHAAEAGMALPVEPTVFLKAPYTVVGPEDDVLIPVRSTKTDWEVELAVVIGRTARYLPDPAAAAAVIAGYAVSHDVSEREFQLERGGQWDKGKSCETFNPLGPWLVTADAVPDPQRLPLWLDVNGERMQSGTTATMVRPVPYLIWYLSRFLVLEPGDVVNTGTPAGVGMGRRPPRYLRAGDVVELGIEGLGRQRQVVRQACADAGPS
jgi:2-keto-4-pentenoate hydratase/2-oxohepta-3-ene-1,7-dioic acid hydratase in catechol pathway